ncbi:MAG: hypothetical protein ACYDDB_08135 [bacterium]
MDASYPSGAWPDTTCPMDMPRWTSSHLCQHKTVGFINAGKDTLAMTKQWKKTALKPVFS